MQSTPALMRLPLVIVTAAVCCWQAAQAGVTQTSHRTVAYSVTAAAAVDEAKRLYIVQLKGAPAIQAQNRRDNERFDANHSDVRDRAERIRKNQERILRSINALDDEVYSYTLTFNGMAVMLTPEQAKKLRLHKSVKAVWQDRLRRVSSGESTKFLGLRDGQAGLQRALGLDGTGVIVGIIDTGIAPGHPSVSDREQIQDAPRLCRSDWAKQSLLGRWLCGEYFGEGDRVFGEPPERWNGACETGENFGEDDCNNKLIGARFYRAGFDSQGGVLDDNEFSSPADADGHGTHMASIVAGNEVEAEILDRDAGVIRGMAPGAMVAVYKACWLEPGRLRASACSVADLQSAIEDAVADGVDIINYSIGGLDYSLTDPDDIALLNATEAGVLAVTSAGNDGADPDGFGTVESPAATPWVIAVGATTRTGSRLAAGIRVNKPEPVADNYEVREASFTPRLKDVEPITGILVLADDESTTTDDGGTGGTIYDACTEIVNTDELADNIALVQRGGCRFDAKLQNAQDAGAVAVVVYNNSADLEIMAGDSEGIEIPAVMIGQADGQLLVDTVQDEDEEEDVEITIDYDIVITFDQDGDVLADFSARGPDLEFLKPDLVAPGSYILGGHTPKSANGYRGEKFQYMSGTSQSAPHVAGVAALLKQANPDWTPAELKSALMTTARRNILLKDGSETTPFDIGAGHIVPNLAVDPGLVYDIDVREYDAFLCGLDARFLSEAGCADLATQGFGQRPEDINLPSIAVHDLVTERTVTRTVRNAGPAATFNARINIDDGVAATISPRSLMLGEGESGTYTVRFRNEGSQVGESLFGELTWFSETHEVYSPIAVMPTYFNVPAAVSGSGASGSLQVPVEFGYNGVYEASTSGLYLPCVLPDNVEDDTVCTNTTTALVTQDDDIEGYFYSVPAKPGVKRFSIRVPEEDDLYLRVSLFDELTDGNDDLDIYLWYCTELLSDGTCDESSVVLEDFSQNDQTSDEELNVPYPSPGVYIIDVHGYNTDFTVGGAGARFRLYAWSFGTANDAGNLLVSGSSGTATLGTTTNLTADWGGLGEGLWLGGIKHSDDGFSDLDATLVEVDNNAFPAAATAP
jgi:subtilisin family serine protease